jgi:multidrug/hemolysin transport system permease protein
MFFIAIFIKSTSAFGAFNGIAGSLVGFISGIYMPLSLYGDSIKIVSSLVPFTHMVIFLKSIILKNAYSALNLAPTNITKINEYTTNENIGLLSFQVPMPVILILILLFGVLLTFISTKKISKQINQ